MSPPRLGDPAPDFELPATGDRTVRLSDLRGHMVVIHFHPRDNTPGCTTEDVLRHEWRGVKVPGHVEDVLVTVQHP